MSGEPGERMRRIVAMLRLDPGLPGQLPHEEQRIVEEALRGDSVHDIAANHQMTEAAVWHFLDDAARLAGGREPAHRVVTGGMAADTGGTGETEVGFGRIGPLEAKVINEEEKRESAEERASA